MPVSSEEENNDGSSALYKCKKRECGNKAHVKKIPSGLQTNMVWSGLATTNKYKQSCNNTACTE